MPTLTADQITIQLKAVSDWAQHAQTIVRTFRFKDFLMSIAFVRRIAKRAEKSSIIRT